MRHLRTVKCKQRTRHILLWPQMRKEIEDEILKCKACLECQSCNSKEPLLPKTPASKPWESVSSDSFKWDGEDYSLNVDSYSHYIEIARLNNTTSQTVVMHTISDFVCHGIPRTVKVDNDPQYTAEEYKKFSKEWWFQHVTTIPHHPQANGLAKKSVQVVKNLLTKAELDKRDPYLNLLEYHNTSVNNIGTAAQLCMSHQLNSLLPCTPEQLTPVIIDSNKVVEVKMKKQRANEEHYDQGTRWLSTLRPNEDIRIQVQGIWVPGILIWQAESSQSYRVNGPSGHEYRRNCKHLRKVAKPVANSVVIDDLGEDPTSRPTLVEHSGNSTQDTTRQTWSGHTVRAPQ